MGGGYGAEQARALLWLRATLTVRRIARRREWGRLLLSIFSLLVGLGVSCAVAAAVWSRAMELRGSPAAVEARGGPVLLFATWLAAVLLARLWFAVLPAARAAPCSIPAASSSSPCHPAWSRR
jgi:hypothetical protein